MSTGQVGGRWGTTLLRVCLCSHVSMGVARERQDADGQMKELQDQLEAEQYFSVSSSWKAGGGGQCMSIML